MMVALRVRSEIEIDGLVFGVAHFCATPLSIHAELVFLFAITFKSAVGPRNVRPPLEGI